MLCTKRVKTNDPFSERNKAFVQISMETPPYLKNPGTVSKETRSFPIFSPSCAQGNFRSAIFANPSRPLGATKSFAAEPNDMKGDPKKSEDHLITRQAPKKVET